MPLWTGSGTRYARHRLMSSQVRLAVAARSLWLAEPLGVTTQWILDAGAGHLPGSIGVVFELQSGARGDGFFVAELVPGGSASESTQVAVGDRLLRVDGTPIGVSSGISAAILFQMRIATQRCHPIKNTCCTARDKQKSHFPSTHHAPRTFSQCCSTAEFAGGQAPWSSCTWRTQRASQSSCA
jgi:hypothetical protein